MKEQSGVLTIREPYGQEFFKGPISTICLKSILMISAFRASLRIFRDVDTFVFVSICWTPTRLNTMIFAISIHNGNTKAIPRQYKALLKSNSGFPANTNQSSQQCLQTIVSSAPPQKRLEDTNIHPRIQKPTLAQQCTARIASIPRKRMGRLRHSIHSQRRRDSQVESDVITSAF